MFEKYILNVTNKVHVLDTVGHFRHSQLYSMRYNLHRHDLMKGIKIYETKVDPSGINV